MQGKLILFFIVFIVACKSLRLRHVIEACRHGARTPKIIITGNPGNWPSNEKEELTQMGMRQHFLLGTELRNRYIKELRFLSQDYNPEEIKVFSTDRNRTIMSAFSQMQGLFPIGTGPQIEKNSAQYNITPPFENSQINIKEVQEKLGYNALPFKLQIFPISHISINDYINTGSDNCPILEKMMDNYTESKEFQNYMLYYNQSLRGIFAKSANITESKADFLYSYSFADLIQCNKRHGYQLPKYINDSLTDQLNLIDFMYFYRYQQPTIEALRLKVGYFYKEMFKSFQNVIQNNSSLKFQLYSGHDDNIAAFIRTLGLRKQIMESPKPTYASNIFFQLWEESQGQGSEYFVKVIYNDQIIKIKSCGELCPYETFKKVFSFYVVEDIKTECSEVNSNKFGKMEYNQQLFGQFHSLYNWLFKKSKTQLNVTISGDKAIQS